MHMADALLSPQVGATMWAASAAAVAWCSRRLGADGDDRRVPLMGVVGAFLFAAQMINFAIPGTGSSGHLGGGLLLAILLGPHAALIVMASVLIVQALFFADGGLLALGCNIFNLGVIPAFVGYPLYRYLCGTAPSSGRATFAAVAAAIVSLQLGAFAVVLQTVASGISALPFTTFALLMQPLHLAIGAVEGLVTAALIAFVRDARPGAIANRAAGTGSARLATAFACAALVLGGVGVWYASQAPDGLEWSVARTAGSAQVGTGGAVHAAMERVQAATAFLPDYAFASPAVAAATGPATSARRIGKTVSGLVGSAIVLGVVLVVGLAMRRTSRS
jgi:cobalt/nickel transport system permease protein